MSEPELREKVFPRLIEDEMRESFLDYSMSVIVQRALPDVRDGLKPVHRRILFAMHEVGLGPNRPHKKSATVVGEVLGKYHPHGDSAVYDSLVRMVQDFSMRYPLIDGQGNFGSLDGDGAAAYRYTEARLTRLATELLADIGKGTVDFVANFDDRLEEPAVLPTRLPNLLVNGSSGIAVGMATNIPPHNLREVVEACIHFIDEPTADAKQLMRFVQGPDFPTGGFVHGLEGIRDAYETGRGRIIMRARTEVEESRNGREQIVVTEIPYMVNKARMIEQIAALVREKKLPDITDLRDESDRDGVRVVLELRRDSIPQIVLNQLFKHTQMQSTFGVILLALVGGVPRVLTLPDLIRHFLDHRHEVVVRRSEHDLSEALDREHILEGWKVAIDAIDEVVELIKSSSDTQAASQRLQERFLLSERQAKAILEMRLARLTALEIDKLEAELVEVRALISELRAILASRERRLQIIKDELQQIAATYGDERRTEIVPTSSDIMLEDLLANEEMVITVSHQGYIKRLPASTYRLQRRGGRGLQGMNTKEEDWVEHLFLARTHDFLLFFTTRGFCYRLKVYEIPQAMRVARGKPMVNLIGLKPGEQIAALVPVRCFDEERHLLFGTRKGVVKKTALAAYGNVRVNGLNAINVLEGDELIAVRMTGGDDDVIIATREGLAIRFHESDVRPMGRATTGVRGISLAAGDTVVGVVVVGKETAADATLLVVSERGLGKRTRIDAYRLQRRGGKGVINIRTNGKTGKVIAIMQVLPDDELMLITRNGIVNRQAVQDIRVIGRATQGVRLLSLGAGDRVTDVARLVAEGEAELGELAVELGDLPVPGLEPVVGLPPDVPEASDS